MKLRVFLFSLVCMLLVTSCANPGTPDGGPYDEEPPRIIGSTPVYGQIGSKNAKIQIFFNELVQLENATEKVVVSPPQLEMPEIASKGKYIEVKLSDSLKSNTTYSIDFSDAIIDNNEGNPLGNYAFVFSTGENIDTMEVAGTVLNAANLEPIKGILVGLHEDMADTAFTKTPFLRVARTNGSGRFVIRGVKRGTYKIYALNDADGDFRYSQKSEMIAFSPQTITTDCFPDVKMDTIWHDSIFYDSIVPVHYTHFMPDNVVLCAFNTTHADRHLLKTERSDSRHFDLFFTGPSTELPTIKGLNFNETDAWVIESNETKDTLHYWLRDTTLIYQDTLEAEVKYLETDSMGILIEQIDTIEFISKFSHEKQVKWAQEAYKKWKKEQNKRKKKGEPYEENYPVPELEMTKYVGNIAPNENLSFIFKEPLARIDTSKIHLYLQKDSIYEEAPYLFRQDSVSMMKYILYGEWRPQQRYRLIVDSAAFIGIYDHASLKIDDKFDIPSLDFYGSLFVNVTGKDTDSGIVQLLTSDKPINNARVKNGTAEFFFVKPGTYFLRMIADKNGNNKWDEGDYDKGLQPEDVYYCPQKVIVKARWDISHDWNVDAVSREKQKPLIITKQKPDQAKTIQNRNAERERERGKR